VILCPENVRKKKYARGLDNSGNIEGNSNGLFQIPSDLVVECVPTHRKPPEVRIWRLSNQSRVGTVRRDCASFHFRPTLAGVLGTTLVGDEIVQVCQSCQKREL
jgi:hypothetical protein